MIEFILGIGIGLLLAAHFIAQHGREEQQEEVITSILDRISDLESKVNKSKGQ